MTIDTTDIPSALVSLDNRVTALETAENQKPASPAASTDPRTDDIIAVLERYFGKELAEAAAARTQPPPPAPTPAAPVQSSPGVNVTPGPVAPTPAPTPAPSAVVTPGT